MNAALDDNTSDNTSPRPLTMNELWASWDKPSEEETRLVKQGSAEEIAPFQVQSRSANLPAAPGSAPAAASPSATLAAQPSASARSVSSRVLPSRERSRGPIGCRE